ncbi:hypothetical protein [Bacillus nitroreducens]
MPYLTYDEYNEFGFAEVDQLEFNKLLERASDAVDSVTRHFYKFNNLTEDVPFRQHQFKKAIAAQIEYFHEMGATNNHGLNEPLTVQIGRTSVSNSSRGSTSQQPQNSLISKDALMYLRDTGLLYRGLGVV